MFSSYFIIITLVILILLSIIIIAHLLAIVINNFLSILNKPNFTGKKIAKLTNKKIPYSDLIFYGIITTMCSIVVLWGINNLNDKEGIVIKIFASLLYTDYFIKNLIRNIKYSYITTKGIYFKKRFYKWNKILQYKWVNSDTVEFKLKGFKNPTYEKLTIDISKKQLLNKQLEHFQLFLNKNPSTTHE